MKVLFLCHANMCRSPLAEGLLRHILKMNNISAEVDSAGFEAFHINESPDDRAIQKAREQGIDISSKRVRLFTKDDFDQFDKIYVMDTLSYRNALYFARNEEDKQKVDYLLNVITPGKNESVPDPFYRSLAASEETFELLHKACKKIADEMISQPLN
jgi:protein-tyrosine phosphatase